MPASRRTPWVALARRRKIEAKLGENWRRPKGMRLATYGRLISAILRCEEEREAVLCAYAHRRFRDLVDSKPFDEVFTERAAPGGCRTKRDIS